MHKNVIITLLCGTTCLSSVAFAQDTSGIGTTQPIETVNVEVQAHGRNAQGVNGRDAGGGLIIKETTPKSRSTVTRDFIATQSPASNVYQMMRMLPGANVSGPDPYGITGGNITVRGMNSDEMGITVEGVPVNDSGNYAVYPQELVDTENLEEVSLAQGSADLDSPHIGASGGVMNIYQRDPSHKYGGYLAFSRGKDDMDRIFARVESGDINGTQARAFASFSHETDHHWAGPGRDQRDHADFKAIDEWGEGSKVSVSIEANQLLNDSYNTVSLSQFQTHSNLYYLPTWTNSTNFYGLHVNPFQNLIASASSKFVIDSQLSLIFTPYFWYGFGNGGGGTSENPSSVYFGDTKNVIPIDGQTKTSVIEYTPSITKTMRPGLISKFNYDIADNKIVGGYWFERAHHYQYGNVTPVNSNGTPENEWGTGGNELATASGKTVMTRNQLTITTTNALFLGDTLSLLNDKLQIDAGIKQVWDTRDGWNYLPGATPYVSFSDSNFVPTAAVRYHVNEQNQLFASIATNFRTPQNYELFQTFSKGVTSQTSSNNQKDEKSVSIEIGHRFQSDLMDTSVTLFNYNFINRQVQTNVVDPATNSTISEEVNAGGQSSRGIDAEAGLTPIDHFRPYVSGEFLHTRMNDNYQVSSGDITNYLPTKGKQAVRAPEVQAAIGLDYDNGPWFADVDGKFVGRQFATFMNDQAIPGYVTADATIGYRFGNMGIAKDPEIKLNLTNIADHRYLSGVSSIQPSSVAHVGTNGSVIAATGTPYYYNAAGFAWVVTISSAF